ncbi:hypothetical protein HD806DRAFT_37137 [Xylariaceae sp. AK1471]|nr:hypothetical protein HD806DRAFT_37137 [Xylariaceae sp. AK1471]
MIMQPYSCLVPIYLALRTDGVDLLDLRLSAPAHMRQSTIFNRSFSQPKRCIAHEFAVGTTDIQSSHTEVQTCFMKQVSSAKLVLPA